MGVYLLHGLHGDGCFVVNVFGWWWDVLGILVGFLETNVFSGASPSSSDMSSASASFVGPVVSVFSVVVFSCFFCVANEGSVDLRLETFFPGSYFRPDTAICNFFGCTAKRSAHFAWLILVLKKHLCSNMWTATATQWVACLAGTLSNLG